MNKMSPEADKISEESIADYYQSHPIAHEQHHAMHALTLFYFMIRKTLLWVEVKRSLVGGIVRHLMDLREFLGDPEMTELVNGLWKSLAAELEKPSLHLYPWFVAHQEKVLQFARHYGKEGIFQDLMFHENE